MGQDNEVILLPGPVSLSEAAVVPSGSSEGLQPSKVQLASDARLFPASNMADKPDAQVQSAEDALAALKEVVETSATAGVQTTLIPEVKVPPRDTSALPTYRPRGRKLRLMTSICAVLIVGWLVGSNRQSIDLSTARSWAQQGGDLLNSALVSAKGELQDRLEQLTRSNAPALQVSQVAPPEITSPADAIERAAHSLTSKLDQMQVSSEGLTRDIRDEVEQLKASVERSQVELSSKLAQIIERIERVEQSKSGPAVPAAAQSPVVTAAPSPEPVTAGAATPPTVPTPPPSQRPAARADVKPISPPPSEVRREPIVIKQWTVREVLNGMALLEGPRGLIGVSPGQTVPGVGRVESIVRQGSRWVVATSNGVISGRVSPQ
jgi:hypothetical protein